VDEAFAAGVLLPAVRANASLSRLNCAEILRGAPLIRPLSFHVVLQGGGGPRVLPSCEEAMRIVRCIVERRPL
jgi:hypothetical protein